jgi:hypothetical protein
MADRLLSAAAIAFIALIPLVPAGMWAYARVASVDRDEALAANERVLADATPLAGARRLGTSSPYERRAWEGEALVPITGYATEVAYRLPRPLPPKAVFEHYRRVLRGWSSRIERVDCATLSLPRGCGAIYAVFRRGKATFELNLAEYAEPDGRVREYGVQVSH